VKLEVWQLCILVTAGIVVAELTVNFLLSGKPNLVLRKRFRTAALGLLAVLTIVVLVIALGPSLADQLISVAAGVAAIAAWWLAYRSYRAPDGSDVDGTGAPDQPHDS
jgi:hypothetical protein